MAGFEVIDISGDAGIKAYGKTLEEAFINAALGMYSLITDLEGIDEKRTLTVEVESHSREGLLVSWLNELIFHFDTYGFIGKSIRVGPLKNNRIEAALSGEDFDPERHERRLLVKAATYHAVRIEEIRGVWELDVIFDI
ncbi:MAG: archease [Thermodesulfovibrionales bacterium]